MWFVSAGMSVAKSIATLPGGARLEDFEMCTRAESEKKQLYLTGFTFPFAYVRDQLETGLREVILNENKQLVENVLPSLSHGLDVVMATKDCDKHVRLPLWCWKNYPDLLFMPPSNGSIFKKLGHGPDGEMLFMPPFDDTTDAAVTTAAPTTAVVADVKKLAVVAEHKFCTKGEDQIVVKKTDFSFDVAVTTAPTTAVAADVKKLAVVAEHKFCTKDEADQIAVKKTDFSFSWVWVKDELDHGLRDLIKNENKGLVETVIQSIVDGLNIITKNGELDRAKIRLPLWCWKHYPQFRLMPPMNVDDLIKSKFFPHATTLPNFSSSTQLVDKLVNCMHQLDASCQRLQESLKQTEAALKQSDDKLDKIDQRLISLQATLKALQPFLIMS
jgi:hypothetical protein